jgi:EAL domain-containing protein (putative c-di-GMP-specific phosphodiesterase class I)
VGVEALVRWQHPLRGLVLPGAFIPIAEESDLVIDVDNWVLKTVCDLLVHPAIAESPIRVSINISPRHFRHPGFVDSVRNLLSLTGADASHLTLEVTEGVMIENMNEIVAKMTELAALGIHFSVDDFGTGYSSLAYLKRMPIHELKIDKTFVQDAPDDPDDAALVEVILSVARHLKLKIVAEGVETQAQADFLNSRAKVIHQGYLFSRPEPAEAWLVRKAAAMNND